MDGPGFSLCATPLESLGAGFWVHGRIAKERAEVWSIPDQRGDGEDFGGQGGSRLSC